MGFYGNTIDLSKTYFQFDRRFANRSAMEQACAKGSDQVFSGRFVLVEYSNDSLFSFGTLLNGFVPDVNHLSKFYLDEDCSIEFQYSTLSVAENPSAENWHKYFISDGNLYHRIPSQEFFNTTQNVTYYEADSAADNIVVKNQIISIRSADDSIVYPASLFYKCTGPTQTNGNIPKWERLLQSEYPPYLVNYNIDKQVYGASFDPRGYDATVWEKVYTTGIGKFVPVARLNGGLMPAIDLKAEPPSTEPFSPYIDTVKSDAMYRIHVPTHWGFRIKEQSNINKSDEQIVQTYYTYDYNNNITDTENREINADIFYNQKGFDKNLSSYNNTANAILLNASGKSGRWYINSSSGQLEQKNDIYELSIHLPIIGNIVSNFYDLIYSSSRKLNTTWYQPTELPNHIHEKTYDLNTAAGLINNFQNRLGQNIIKLSSQISDTMAQSLDPQYIYQVDFRNSETNTVTTTYYRIGPKYKYTIVPEYSDLGVLSASSYEPNKYYIRNGSSYVLAQNSFSSYDSNTHFYRKNISYNNVTTKLSNNNELYEPYTYYLNEGESIATEAYQAYSNTQPFYEKNISAFKFQPIELEGYVANKYYYLNAENNYIRDDKQYSPTYKSTPYYDIKSSNIQSHTFSTDFQPNRYYKYDEENKTYDIATESIPTTLETYYTIVSNSTAMKNSAGQSVSSGVLYQPGRYYYYERWENNTTPVGPPQLATWSDYQPSYVYFYIPLKEDKQYYVYTNQNGELEIVYGQILDIEHQQKITNMCWLNNNVDLDNVYIKQGNSFLSVKDISVERLNVSYQYYILTINELENYFIPNKFYKLDYNNNYILQSTWTGDSEDVYYLFVNLKPLNKPFYEPDKYYYFNNNTYWPDHSIEKQNRDYFKASNLYVFSDSTGRWPKGFEWQEQALFVPASVILATREEVMTAYELEGINNEKSSLNGSILNFNHFTAFDSLDIRNTNTVQGNINKLNDLLQNIKTNLIPNRILYINDFGQIATSSITIDELKALLS